MPNRESEASIEFLPSNDDPFAYIVTEAAQFEGMTEDEIIDYCANRLWAPVRTGRYIDTYGKLTPGTEYYAIAYGNYNGEVTTGLFKESFTTTDTWVGTREFSLEYGPWYAGMMRRCTVSFMITERIMPRLISCLTTVWSLSLWVLP